MSDRTANPSTRAGFSRSVPDDAAALRGRLESFFRARQAETRGRWPENFQHPPGQNPASGTQNASHIPRFDQLKPAKCIPTPNALLC